MVTIVEDHSKKIPAVTSLYIKLDTYNKLLFDTIVQTPNIIYDSKTYTFEAPVNKLQFLVNIITKFDNCSFKYLRTQKNDYITCDNYKFKVKPYKHQIEGIEYGLNNTHGWLLLDDQGLGKTFQMICLADNLRQLEGLQHCLVICGVNSLKNTWLSEVSIYSDLDAIILGQKITKRGKLVIGSVADRLEHLKSDIKEFFVITNMQTLQSKEFADAFKKSKTKFDMIVFDEAHRVKNPSSMSAKTLMKLKAKRRIGLSGTVIMNKPEDAYVPLKWTDNVSCNYTQFKNMFNVYGGFGGVQVVGYKNLNILQDLIKSCSLRRLKKDVLDLPERTFITERVDMGKEQQDLYNQVAEGIAKELDLLPGKPTIIQELTINMRLRQITAYPGIVSTAVTKSAKLERLEELVETIVSQGDKVVVFNTFKGAAYVEKDLLSQYNPVICTGDQDDDEINMHKHTFMNDPTCKVMIATWQKMGTGHTLTAASYMIFVDTPWTQADFSQASDRIYRIGQKNACTIITLITNDSYDERVAEILDRKEQLAGYLTDNSQIRDLNIFGE